MSDTQFSLHRLFLLFLKTTNSPSVGSRLTFPSCSRNVSPLLPLTSLLSLPAAKQKLEDRLAAAAREKLAQASKESKEKQLQAERKRKAALFLQTLRGPSAGEPEAKRAELDSSAQLEVRERPSEEGRNVWNVPQHKFSTT